MPPVARPRLNFIVDSSRDHRFNSVARISYMLHYTVNGAFSMRVLRVKVIENGHWSTYPTARKRRDALMQSTAKCRVGRIIRLSSLLELQRYARAFRQCEVPMGDHDP